MSQEQLPEPLLNNLDTVIDNLNALDTVHSKGEALLGGQISDPDLLDIAQNALAERELDVYTALNSTFDTQDFAAVTEHQEQLEETKAAEQEEYDARKDKLIKETDAIISALFENDPEGQEAVLAKRDEKLSAIAAEQTQAAEAGAELQALKLRTESAFRPWPIPRFVTGKQLQERLGAGEITETEVEPEAIAVEGTAAEVHERSFAELNVHRTLQLVSSNLGKVLTRAMFNEHVFFDQSTKDSKTLSARLTYLLNQEYREVRKTSALPALEEAGIVMQRGKMWVKGEDGGKFGRFQFVYRGILATEFNPDIHNTDTVDSDKIVEWEPIDVDGNEKMPDEPDEVPPAPQNPEETPNNDATEPETGEEGAVVDGDKNAVAEAFHKKLSPDRRASVYRQIRELVFEYLTDEDNKYKPQLPVRIALDVLDSSDIATLQKQCEEHGFTTNAYVRSRIVALFRTESPALDELEERLRLRGLILQVGDLETKVPHAGCGVVTTRYRIVRVMASNKLNEEDFKDSPFEHEDLPFKSGIITWNMTEAHQKQIAKNKLKAAERAAAGTASGAALAMPRISGGATPQNRAAAPAGSEASSQAQSETQQWIDKITSFTGQAMSALDAISALGTTHRPESRLRIRIDKLDMNGQGKIRTQKLFKQIREAGLATGTDTSRTVRDMVMMYLITDPSIQPLLTHEKPEVRRWAKQVVDKGIKDFYLGRGERERRERALSRS